jgi:hypothetical protein
LVAIADGRVVGKSVGSNVGTWVGSIVIKIDGAAVTVAAVGAKVGTVGVVDNWGERVGILIV